MDLDPELVAYGLTIVLGLLATAFGKKWQTAKDTFAKGQLTTMKLAQTLKVVSDAIADDKITAEEEKKIIAIWKDTIDEAKGIVKNSTVENISRLEEKIDFLLEHVE